MRKLGFPLISALLLTTACDSEATESDTQRAAERSDSALGQRASMAVGMVCLKLDCSEQQRTELTAIAHSALPDEDQRARHEQALQTFADAFRADDLDTDLLTSLHDQRMADREHMRDSFLAAHQVLDGRQRGELADMVQGGFGPSGRMKIRNAGPDSMAEHVASRLCDVAACEDEQEAAISAAIADGAPRPSAEEVATMSGRLAEVLRTDELDTKSLDRMAAEVQAKHDAFRPQALDMLSEVHTLLSSEQRDAVATALEREGPHGLMGPGAMRR
ncbi:MAG: hypothetical protein AAGA54_26280 [Myxococcota bacterium]